jgi:uroporphyrinogen III methyltransferase/synthase
MSGLEGKRIVVTRAEEQAQELCRELESAGARVVRCPAIRVAAPESYGDLDRALGRLEQYRWLAFTSTNGVRAVLARMAELDIEPAALDPSRVAAVGSGTAGALRSRGIQPVFVSGVERSAALARTLEPVRGERILLARADIADPGVAGILRERGAERVDDIVAYRTLLLAPSPEALGELRRGVDGITFTSPSTVRGFLRIDQDRRALLSGVRVASLGPATTAVARSEGLEVDVEAVEKSMKGLVEALARAFGAGTDGIDEESES